jgi:ABC-type phosphate transport system permease subunit
MTSSEPLRRTCRATTPLTFATIQGLLVTVLSAFSSAVTVLAQSVPDKPIIVSIPPDKPKSELSGLADVLIGSLGLTGIIVIAAVLMGAIMAALMFWVRSRSD